jgi:hypothetical protein
LVSSPSSAVGTAEHIYEECDGLQYEHCGGKLDLRFIPDDMMFDERELTSVVTETSVPVGYTPPDFVTAALQQSKVHLTWDETDPKRLQTTMRKFSRDDMLKMDFDAYLGSSSGSDSGSECGTPGEGGAEPNRDHTGTKLSHRVAKYRSLLRGDGEEDEGEEEGEVMEVSWEPGLREEVKERVRENTGDGGTTWDQYLRERKKKKKKEGNHGDEETTHGDHGNEQSDLGFDDPFFSEDVAMTMSEKPGKSKRRSKKAVVEGDEQNKSELELLMMEEEGQKDRAHFSLDAILQSEEKAGKKRRKRKETSQVQPVKDSFEVDVKDTRFSALYSSHEFAPDPSHPHFRATKAMSAIMEERRKRRERGGAMGPETTPTNQEVGSALKDPSVARLVKAVRSKSKSFNSRREKMKAKRKHLI